MCQLSKSSGPMRFIVIRVIRTGFEYIAFTMSEYLGNRTFKIRKKYKIYSFFVHGERSATFILLS